MDDSVEVWQAPLTCDEDGVQRLWGLLSPDEADRAARFRFAALRDAFVVARGVLRTVLARHTGQHPAELAFTYGRYGKPALPGGPEFNQSHSGDLTLVAVAGRRRVGVDVEQVRGDVSCEALARRFFSARENAQLAQLPAADRRAGFFACWARKEAFVKAKGLGLSLPLHAFDVEVAPYGLECWDAAGLPLGPQLLLATRPDEKDAGAWRLRALDAGPGYAAALAVEGDGWRLAPLAFTPEDMMRATGGLAV